MASGGTLLLMDPLATGRPDGGSAAPMLLEEPEDAYVVKSKPATLVTSSVFFFPHRDEAQSYWAILTECYRILPGFSGFLLGFTGFSLGLALDAV